ncbi:MAG TPA: SBBP repeat-containing protein [Myxococcus sp.]|nr:SBBP repeat-containing protein [Myxococcus sp.]
MRYQQSPSTLGYSAFVGPSGMMEVGKAVAVDASGNAYVTGYGELADRTRYVFVAKQGPTGQTLYYAYFPGREGRAIAVDSTGHAYVTGDNTDGWGFVAKLDPSGSAFVYYARIQVDPDDMAVDALGNAYLAGSYAAPGRTELDVWVGKLNPSGSAFHYAVGFGGSGWDEARGIAIDSVGNAYLTGITDSPNFPLWNAFQGTFSGMYAAFVTKLNAAGNGLVYSTFLSGPGTSTSLRTLGHDIAVDGASSAYVVGYTSSSQFPVTPGAAQTVFRGSDTDGYLVKLSATGTRLYATYIGGSSYDIAYCVAVDDTSGVAYVAGDPGTGSGFPITSNAFQSVSRGPPVFVTQVSTSGGPFLYSSFLGGSSYQFTSRHCIALDAAKNVYIAGSTQSPDFPATVYAYGGGIDAFITKFNGP